MELHWKSKIRGVHTKLIARDAKAGEDGEFVELWEQIAAKNVPMWALKLLGEPEKAGWAIKKGGIGGGLTKRWFVLSGPLLFYFSNDAADSRAKGIVPLTASEVVPYEVPEKEAVKFDKKAQKKGLKIGYCFAVRTRMREFVISCDTTVERDEWVAACVVNAETPLSDAAESVKFQPSILKRLLTVTENMRKDVEAGTLPPTSGDLSPRGSSGSLTASSGRLQSPRGNTKTQLSPRGSNAQPPTEAVQRQPSGRSASVSAPDSGPAPTSQQQTSPGGAGTASGSGGSVALSASRKDIEMGGKRSPRGPAAATQAEVETPDVDESDGALLGGWLYDPEGQLRTYDVKTDGTWPFNNEDKGLFVNCKYSWNGTKLRAQEGSGSKGDWNGTMFRWHCCNPVNVFHKVYEYNWDSATKRFTPAYLHAKHVAPVWEYDGKVMKNANGVNTAEFPNVEVDGSAPPPVALAVAMHKFQWKVEEELTRAGTSTPQK